MMIGLEVDAGERSNQLSPSIDRVLVVDDRSSAVGGCRESDDEGSVGTGDADQRCIGCALGSNRRDVRAGAESGDVHDAQANGIGRATDQAIDGDWADNACR